MNISAVVVTKGDRDLSEVVESLTHFDEIIIWDNSKSCMDMKVFGRFAGAYCARNNWVYVQDDDCLINSKKLVSDFESIKIGRDQIYSNFPVDRRLGYLGSGITLIGWGTLFHTHHLQSFDQYLNKFPKDDLFIRECDRVFTYLNRRFIVETDLGVIHLDAAHGMDRMGTEFRHGADLTKIKSRLHSGTWK